MPTEYLVIYDVHTVTHQVYGPMLSRHHIAVNDEDNSLLSVSGMDDLCAQLSAQHFNRPIKICQVIPAGDEALDKDLHKFLQYMWCALDNMIELPEGDARAEASRLVEVVAAYMENITQ